jgi:excinuclease UvrABC nuclease subunit
LPVYHPLDFALTKSNWVYRMFDSHGEALYVGKTCGTAIIQRLSQHLTAINPTHRKPWADEVKRVDVTAFDTPEEAKAEEDLQIKRLNPKYNKSGKPMAGSSTLPGFEW